MVEGVAVVVVKGRVEGVVVVGVRGGGGGDGGGGGGGGDLILSSELKTNIAGKKSIHWKNTKSNINNNIKKQPQQQQTTTTATKNNHNSNKQPQQQQKTTTTATNNHNSSKQQQQQHLEVEDEMFGQLDDLELLEEGVRHGFVLTVELGQQRHQGHLPAERLIVNFNLTQRHADTQIHTKTHKGTQTHKYIQRHTKAHKSTCGMMFSLSTSG